MKVLSQWIRSYVSGLAAGDRELAEALTLRGIAVEGIFELGSGQGSLFEMDITTNRVDAMNHYGIAREAAAIDGCSLAILDTTLPDAKPTEKPIAISIEAGRLCGRFTARSLSGVRIQPSSGIVAERFALLEQKLISNAVDATNYVTLAMGHPTHVFDRDKLEGGIFLRRARAGEKLRTLDGVDHVLDPEDLIVADEKKPIALAGIMGGWDTMIGPETTNILVEAAWFDPATIRRSSRRHGLHTDASHRFERGADFNAPPVASALVSRLILASGGALATEMVDVVVPEAEALTARRPPVRLCHGEVRRILGPTEDARGIEPQTVETILRSLGCSVSEEPEGACTVALPAWRLDLEREVDLIEEIARVYGYDRFASTLPAFSGIVCEARDATKHETIRRTLLALGWNEAISSTFCSVADAVTFSSQPGMNIPLGNPLSEEAGMLRPSLVPGMLTMLGHNFNRNLDDLRLFETGTVFTGHTDRVDERPALAIGAAGVLSIGPHLPPRAIDFYELKGTIEELMAKFAAPSFYIDTFPSDAAIPPGWLHPGRWARAVAGGSTVAWFGQLDLAEAQRRKLKQAVYIAEIYLDRLYRLPLRHAISRELSRFQPVRRDFSFVFPDAVRWQAVAEALGSLRIMELSEFAPREIFRERTGNKTMPSGHYSILISVVFQTLDRTLREDELQGYSQSIVKALQALGGKQRA